MTLSGSVFTKYLIKDFKSRFLTLLTKLSVEPKYNIKNLAFPSRFVSNFFILSVSLHHQFSYIIDFDEPRYKLKQEWQCRQKYKQ